MPETNDLLYRELFRQTLRIRMVEERIIEIYPSDKVQSPVHLSIGQEATAVGICSSLSKNDILFSNYRGHGFYLAKGGSLKSFFAELFGRATGMAGGKAGSMHLASPDVSFQGCSAIVASSIPHAVGAALAARLLGKEQRVNVVFGDGATEEGVYYESLNFAALHRLPVIFICENNKYAVHASLASRQAYKIGETAKLFGIPYARIDEGYDPLIVRQKYIAATRKDDGPVLIEVITHRHKEHVGVGDDFDLGYRPHTELNSWNAKDPLIQKPELISEFHADIVAEIDAAVAYADQSPLPDSGTILEHVI